MANFGEILGALLSFLFNKAMKLTIGTLYLIYLAFNRKAEQWQVLSAETLKSPLSLPVLMTKAPRWNTHAIIGTLGPFKVKETVEIDLQSAYRSASSWIAIFYSFPGYQTIASLESKHCNLEEQWATVPLKPGKYTIGLRYYDWFNSVTLPTVRVDGKEISAQPVSADVNQFYEHLIARKNWFYLGLHYYIFTLLKLRQWLPESFVRREYLPVGATDTFFLYGYLKKSEKLQMQLQPEVLENYNIYLTLYDRSSLPLSWCRIQQAMQTIDPISNNGFYLVRVRQKLDTVDFGLNGEDQDHLKRLVIKTSQEATE